VDFLALSFVRRAGDVAELRALVDGLGQRTAIVAKIEKPEALADIDAILQASDGLMVARGDLGVEMPPEVVPIVQRDLVRRARLAARPVIVATQMLESMVENPQPTRAEVSDVSAAVYSGADAVMLSAETAIGAYPVRAVEMMDRVARQVENWEWQESRFRSLAVEEAPGCTGPEPDRQAVARSTAQLSRDLQVRAIVVRSRNGTSARVVSANRPSAPVVGLSTEAAVVRRMALLWGVLPRLITAEEFERPREVARQAAAEMGLAEAGQVILLLAGFGKREPSITVLAV
jgi:pyruvate kinase